jgi:predicted metal-dependent HD superfamily phosphohydrolase
MEDLNAKTKWETNLELDLNAEVAAGAKQHAFQRKEYSWVRDRDVNSPRTATPPSEERLAELSGRLHWGESLYKRQEEMASAPPTIFDCSQCVFSLSIPPTQCRPTCPRVSTVIS